MPSSNEERSLLLLSLYIGGLNNGWNLIMENITCGDGNHE